jgi:hypothetical protein
VLSQPEVLLDAQAGVGGRQLVAEVSDSLMPLLEQANTMTDEEVKGLVREQLGKEMAKGSGVLRYRAGRVGFEPQ